MDEVYGMLRRNIKRSLYLNIGSLKKVSWLERLSDIGEGLDR